MRAGAGWICGVVLVALLAACAPAETAPTAIPTLTPTPRSTPLPTLTPTAAPGSAANPVQVAAASDSPAVADALAQALAGATGLDVRRLAVQDQAALVELACAPDGPPALLVLNGLGYALAAARGCGQVLATAEPFGPTVRMIARNGAGIARVADVAGRALCRISLEDPLSWGVAVLMLRADGVDVRGLRDVIDVPDPASIVAAAASGTCDAAVLAQPALNALGEAALSGIRLLEPAVVYPEQIVLATRALPLSERQLLADALRMAGQGAFAGPDAEALAGWLAFAAEGGLGSAATAP